MEAARGSEVALVDLDANTLRHDGQVSLGKFLFVGKSWSLVHVVALDYTLVIDLSLLAAFIFENLFLDDVLVEHLLEELKGFLVDQFVVQPLAVSWLHDVPFLVSRVLLANP